MSGENLHYKHSVSCEKRLAAWQKRLSLFKDEVAESGLLIKSEQEKVTESFETIVDILEDVRLDFQGYIDADKERK